MKVRDLAGNSEENPYAVKVKGSSSPDVFSLIFKVINPWCKSNNQKAIQAGPFEHSFSFGHGSSSESYVRYGLSQEPKEIVSSSLLPSIPSHRSSASFNRAARKSGSEMDGTVLRRRLVVGSEDTDTA
ncbi:hypothetical protein MP638_003418 [Amoeboaphelidium occidentale]|nr:hypothetical protein MP638_003418 [Amoeboaphelidium occidentale]